MILFSCSCGAAYAVDDKYAGGSAQCEKCGLHVPIPQQSDPGVALIYKSGESEDGIPMMRTEVERMFASGELKPADLIWQDNTWRPLSEAFAAAAPPPAAAPAPKPKLRLKKQEQPGAAPPAAEEDVLEDLAPIQTVSLDDTDQAKSASKRGRLLGGLSRSGKKEKKPKKAGKETPVYAEPVAVNEESAPAAVEAEAGAGEPEPEEAGKKTVNRLVQLGVALLAVAVGYKFGIGPLISNIRKQPTLVVVHNHDDAYYRARLGWRRLTEELPGKAQCRFRLYVGMREKQGLRITPVEPGKGKSCKIRVPLQPGATVLVNLPKRGDYAVFDLAKVKGRKVGGASAKLGAEIMGRKPPNSAWIVGRGARNIGKDAFLKTIDDQLIYDRDYELERAAYVAANELKQRKPKDPVKPKPLLAYPRTCRVPFADGWCQYDCDQPQVIEAGVTVPLKPFSVSRNRRIDVERASLTLKGDENNLTLAMSVRGDVEVDGQKVTGTWRYAANVQQKGRWSWSWTFDGRMSRQVALRITVDAAGKETVRKIRED